MDKPDDSRVGRQRCSKGLGIYTASGEFDSVEHAIKIQYQLIQPSVTLFCATYKSFRCDVNFSKSSGFISDQTEVLGQKVNFLIS